VSRSPRGYRLCADLGCDVEIGEDKKYCEAHDWRIGKWLKESRERLDAYKIKHQEAI
jgi:hypothetical protein